MQNQGHTDTQTSSSALRPEIKTLKAPRMLCWLCIRVWVQRQRQGDVSVQAQSGVHTHSELHDRQTDRQTDRPVSPGLPGRTEEGTVGPGLGLLCPLSLLWLPGPSLSLSRLSRPRSTRSDEFCWLCVSVSWDCVCL